MSDLLKTGQQWLSSKLTAHASREVVYRRGEQQQTLTATIGKTIAEQDSGNGLLLRTEIRDYLINTNDLKLGGQQILPERGDQIIESDVDAIYVYEVLPIGNQRAWRYSDPFRLKLRIHTRLIETQTSS
jgi:hypothetical protein